MTTKIYFNNEKFIAGITLKNEKELEQHNMALHVCDNEEDVVQNRQKLAHTSVVISNNLYVPIKPIAITYIKLQKKIADGEHFQKILPFQIPMPFIQQSPTSSFVLLQLIAFQLFFIVKKAAL